MKHNAGVDPQEEAGRGLHLRGLQTWVYSAACGIADPDPRTAQGPEGLSTGRNKSTAGDMDGRLQGRNLAMGGTW